MTVARREQEMPEASTIVPYTRSPDALLPGQPLFFATALPLSGFATGVLTESHMGLSGAAHVISSTA